MSILVSFMQFIKTNWEASAIAGGLLWDGVKGILLKPCIQKLGTFFDDEKQCEKFLKETVEQESANSKKPYRDLEDLFEQIVGKAIDEQTSKELREAFQQIIKDNIDALCESYESNKSSTNQINIHTQNANRDIFNINSSKGLTINNGK